VTNNVLEETCGSGTSRSRPRKHDLRAVRLARFRADHLRSSVCHGRQLQRQGWSELGRLRRRHLIGRYLRDGYSAPHGHLRCQAAMGGQHPTVARHQVPRRFLPRLGRLGDAQLGWKYQPLPRLGVGLHHTDTNVPLRKEGDVSTLNTTKVFDVTELNIIICL